MVNSPKDLFYRDIFGCTLADFFGSRLVSLSIVSAFPQLVFWVGGDEKKEKMGGREGPRAETGDLVSSIVYRVLRY